MKGGLYMTIEFLLTHDFTAKEIGELNPTETVIALWKEDGLKVVDECAEFSATHDEMEMSEFLTHCTACGGNWGGMFLTGIKALAPAVWGAIPDDMGVFSFLGISMTMNLMGVHTEREG